MTAPTAMACRRRRPVDRSTGTAAAVAAAAAAEERAAAERVAVERAAAERAVAEMVAAERAVATTGEAVARGPLADDCLPTGRPTARAAAAARRGLPGRGCEPELALEGSQPDDSRETALRALDGDAGLVEVALHRRDRRRHVDGRAG